MNTLLRELNRKVARSAVLVYVAKTLTQAYNSRPVFSELSSVDMLYHITTEARRKAWLAYKAYVDAQNSYTMLLSEPIKALSENELCGELR